MRSIFFVLIVFGMSLPALYAEESDFSEPAFSDGDPFTPYEEPDCGPGAYWVPEVERCRVEAVPPELSAGAEAVVSLPPIAGIPYEECREIHQRHKDRLGQLPGVTSVGFGRDGINVYTSEPRLVPEAVEGLPIQTFPLLLMQDSGHMQYPPPQPE